MPPITPQRRKELRAIYANAHIAGAETIIGLLDLVEELERQIDIAKEYVKEVNIYGFDSIHAAIALDALESALQSTEAPK